MAEQTNGKRALPSKVAAMKARKRQKLEASEFTVPAQVERTSEKSNKKRKAASTQPERRKANPNSLKWQEVKLPDRMDDWEGILAFEEIDDVDVVRQDGQIAFLARPAAESTAEDIDQSDHDDDADSWAGFDDDTTDPNPHVAAQNGTVPMDNDATKSKDSAKSKVNEKKDKKEKAKEKVKAKKAQNSSAKDADSTQAPSAKSAFDALAEDTNDSAVDVSAWRPLKLCPDTMAALAALKFSKPTAIQKSVIPEVLAGHDVIGKASTGSGKTLAFGIPILERFLESKTGADGKRVTRAPLALILLPTRELAHQLDQHLTSLCSSGLSRRPWIATLTGGLSLQKQQRLLKDADIVVATPGRLWEIISSGRGIAASLRKIEFLVVDEADRLLSEGQFKEVEEILNSLDRVDDEEGADEGGDVEEVDSVIKDGTNADRQTLVFSATFDRALQKKLVGKVNRQSNLLSSKESMEYLLGKLNFREEEPKFIDANPVNQLATGLREGLIECSGTEKDLYLYALLLLHSASRAMVFTNSISAVRRITPLLQYLNVNAMALHSGMPQKARLRSIERFSQKHGSGRGQRSVLIATDVAARGLDIKNVDLVVHYHLPRAADTYVHRSGRTARAGQQGSSILICGPEEVAGVRRLVAKVHAHSAATKEDGTAAKQGYYIRTLDIDRRVVSRLRDRAALAKKLADATIAKEKQHKEDDFMRSAAEELGVDYDSEEFEKEATGKRGRGNGRKKKEREARELTKGELGAMKAELKELLRQRVNVGVSEKYITSGRVDVEDLLRQMDEGAGKTGEFLGNVGNLGLEDN